MKFLESKAHALVKRANAEHKMLPGVRIDQKPEPKHKPDVIKLADELDVDLGSIKGTGTGGAVLVRDIRAAKEASDRLAQLLETKSKEEL